MILKWYPPNETTVWGLLIQGWHYPVFLGSMFIMKDNESVVADEISSFDWRNEEILNCQCHAADFQISTDKSQI